MAAKGSRSGVAVVAGLVLSLTACGFEDPGAAAAGVTHEVDSTGTAVVVRNAGQAPRWRLEPLIAVGSAGSNGEPGAEEFGRVTAVTTDRTGALWVADGLGQDIRVFDARGALVRRVGREGQGPGEFLSIYSLAWVGDVLLVLDLGNGRVAELSESGEWLGTRPAPGSVGGRPATLRFYPVADTTVLQWSLRPEENRATLVWVEHGPHGVSGAWPQLVVAPPAPTMIRCEGSGTRSYFDVPLGPRMRQHPAGGRVTYIAWTEGYRIAVVNVDGDTLRVVERDRPRIDVSDAEWAEANADLNDFLSEHPDAKCQPDAPDRPQRLPAIRNLLVDPSGRLWVEVNVEGGTEWDVFDAQGFLMGTVPGFAYLDRVAPSIRGDLIAWVEADGLGVERVRVARLVQ